MVPAVPVQFRKDLMSLVSDIARFKQCEVKLARVSARIYQAKGKIFSLINKT